MISSQDRSEAIRNIMEQASTLAFNLGTQRCRLEFFMPQINKKINRDPSTYMDENNQNDVELAGGVIKLIVAPGLRRTGDGRGYSYHEIANICPASVYLK